MTIPDTPAAASSIVKYEAGTIERVINTIIQPYSSYFDPLSQAHSEASVDLGPENIYPLESMGIPENKSHGSLD